MTSILVVTKLYIHADDKKRFSFGVKVEVGRTLILLE